MRHIATGLAIALMAAFMATGVAQADSTISGNYMEARTCDVYVAACFANSEVNLTGQEAVLAWDITQGSWKGVSLAGLKVLAVVRASATLGDTAHNPYPAKAILILDERANVAQKEALADFAQEMGGELVSDIVRVEETAISISRTDTCSEASCASLQAKGLVDITARCLQESDKHCGNEVPYYPPLTNVYDAMLHATITDSFQGEGLGVKWASGGRNNLYLAKFSR